MVLKLNICGAHSALSTLFLNCPTPHRPNRLFYMSDHDDHNCNPSTTADPLALEDDVHSPLTFRYDGPIDDQSFTRELAETTKILGVCFTADPCPDFALDPALLAISIPQPRPANNDPLANDTATQPLSLALSPTPSTSSLADLGPMTPSSAGWDAGTPEVFSGLGFSEDGRFYRSGRDAECGDGGQGMWHRAIRNSMVKAQHVNEGVVEDAGNVLLELSAGLAKGNGKAKAVTTKSRGKKSDRDAGQVQPVAATTQQFGATTIPGSYFTPPTALQTRVLTAATTGTVLTMCTLCMHTYGISFYVRLDALLPR